MADTPLENLRIVLVEPSHPGNIGAAARAMKVMGLQQLVLVKPLRFPAPEALAMASGAEDLLNRAEVCADLDGALRGCHRVYGASARNRHVSWPNLGAREAAASLRTDLQAGPCALIFGRERTGLSNAELDRCQVLVTIPTAGCYSSLNLGQAVQVLAYEVFMAAGAESSPTGGILAPMAAAEEMEGFYRHLQGILQTCGFLQAPRETQMMRRLRRLFDRATPSANEVHILRGILTELERWAGKGKVDRKNQDSL
ncbi:RNA methyltransferase [Acidithiobacillus sulfuriphilus]|uniref:tRNA (cytidine/uridine-2'-O-)-methyltransferase TrmJ n=2 Tax=Acidithiobacillus sulfuriphilus TaxID=1867749 RepID=A0A3M8QWC9_9PROT|nr:RNA methyltransferase [Acidithiobacillus sulfuriphilus]RNF60566.1 RNA methyltransferase [Acidithiobacillus sulfuriphilus]